MNSSPVAHETREGVAFVTLNRPEARNALSVAMVDTLAMVLRECEADKTVRAIVLRGAGGHFCAGADLKDMAAARKASASNNGPDGDDASDALANINAQFGMLTLDFARTHVPVVAVLEGTVMGGGFGLACVADVAIASTTADFRLPETSLGLIPAQIAPFLVERLGFSQAKRLALTGARLNAHRALEVGLVHRVVDPINIDAAIESELIAIRRTGPSANAATKQMLNSMFGVVSEDNVLRAAQWFAQAAQSEEALQGLNAFLQKRSAPWVPS